MLATTSTGLIISAMVLFFVDGGALAINDVTRAASIGGVAGLVVIPVAGRLARAYSAKTVYTSTLFIQALVLSSWHVVSAATATTLAIIGFSVCVAAVNATVGSFITELGIPAPDMALTRAALRTISNIGIGCGGLIAGLCLRFGQAGIRTAIALAGLFTLLAFLNAWRTRTVEDGGDGGPGRPITVSGSPYREPRYVGLFLSNGILSTHTEVLTFALPAVVLLWGSDRIDMVGLCTALNALLVILFQMKTTRRAATLRRTTSIAIATTATVVMTVLIAASGHVTTAAGTACIIAAVIALTVGELWQSSVEFDVSYAAAPDDNHQEYQAAYAFGRTLARAAAPVALGWAIVHGDGGWFALGCVYLVAGVVHATLATTITHGSTR
ncbi:MFS transporter [Corynebacterium pygosceleis]|uniref:MFS transporter n=1 Tax=Corynebacterium pygosceleis TaxID=2800406 RepID=A0A9Q4C9B7_9CORY|nr:MFS transporter [Corynebacterium pygosceleis]MCK7636412.1 hypothetical protein [Corynebacterium pygosceleis]MCK7674985.1 hypothetical protein [Corynebacterium pygosceleis]MCL0121396.1 hypothetical protein [Corynebacterium pygosceleis]MCX7445603.1 hypothetical protein [Corynebacterium pygosceleis]MCX7469274.1 hypothetical protein [Corynebacterium pygosceleis]